MPEYTLRVRRGFHTVLAHWPEEFPPNRWMRARRRSRAQANGRADSRPLARS